MNRKQLGQTRITNAKDSRKTVTNSQIGLHFLEHGGTGFFVQDFGTKVNDLGTSDFHRRSWSHSIDQISFFQGLRRKVLVIGLFLQEIYAMRMDLIVVLLPLKKKKTKKILIDLEDMVGRMYLWMDYVPMKKYPPPTCWKNMLQD